MDAEAVYCIDVNGKVTRVLSQLDIERPNGLAITPDARLLYIIDSHSFSIRWKSGRSGSMLLTMVG